MECVCFDQFVFIFVNSWLLCLALTWRVCWLCLKSTRSCTCCHRILSYGGVFMWSRSVKVCYLATTRSSIHRKLLCELAFTPVTPSIIIGSWLLISLFLNTRNYINWYWSSFIWELNVVNFLLKLEGLHVHVCLCMYYLYLVDRFNFVCWLFKRKSFLFPILGKKLTYTQPSNDTEKEASLWTYSLLYRKCIWLKTYTLLGKW